MIEDKTKYYVYVDYTTEATRRPYYVGKGNIDRVLFLERNERHDCRMRHLGIDRIVVYETYDESSAFDVEKQFVSELHTFIHDPLCSIGSNYTEGGEGPSGLRHSEETKHIIRKKRALQVMENGIPVAQYDCNGNLITVYESISRAVEVTGIGNICGASIEFDKSVTPKFRPRAGGFQWRRIDDFDAVPQKISPISSKQEIRHHGVIQYDLNGVELARFDSMIEASRASGVGVGTIAKYCKHGFDITKSKTFYWKYIDEPATAMQDDYVRGTPRCVAQYDVEDNLIAVYKSAAEAHRVTGVPAIIDRCYGRVKNVGQYKWKFYVHPSKECNNIKPSKVKDNN